MEDVLDLHAKHHRAGTQVCQATISVMSPLAPDGLFG